MGLSGFLVTPEGARNIQGMARKKNRRNDAHIPEALLETSRRTQVYIFNVGPWKHVQWGGSFGAFTIPACPEGKEYGEPLTIPGIPMEQYPRSENDMSLLMDDGFRFATDLIGIGRGQSPSNSLIQYGVFVSRTNPPSKEEIAAARQALFQRCEQYVAEANQAQAEGPKMAEQTITADRHFVAARLLKKTEAEAPWLSRSIENKARVNCPFCDRPITASAPKCMHCGEIVNRKAYDAIKQAIQKGE